MFAGIFDENRATARLLILGLIGVVAVGAAVVLLFGGVFSDGGDAETPDIEDETDPAANESEVVDDPEAAFEVNADEPIVGETVTLNANASTVDEDGEIVAYDWAVGDEASGAVVEQTFDEAGDHEVTLTVETDAGASDTVSQTISVEPVPDTAGASFAVYEQDNSSENNYNNGEIVLRDDGEEVVDRRALSLADWHEFDDLDYSENYSVTVETDEWYDERVEFEAGEVERGEIVVGYEFKTADSFRYVTYQDFDGDRQETLEAKGEHAANGNALYYVQRINFDGSDAAEVGYYTETGVNETTWGIGSITQESNEYDGFGWGYAGFPYTDPVSEGVDSYDDHEFITRTKVSGIDDRFVGEWTEDKELDLYRVDVSEKYSDPPESLYGTVDVYVNPETGYVVRTEADTDVFDENNVHDAEVTFEYKDHGEEIEFNDFDVDDLAPEPPF